MKCRRVKDSEDGRRTIVYFGSYGKNDDGTAKFYNPNNKHDNYSDGQTGVKDSLIQRLSVLRGELWYNVSYGIPIDMHSKLAVDSQIANIVLSHPDVVSILQFKSNVTDRQYHCNLVIQSKFGIVDVVV